MPFLSPTFSFYDKGPDHPSEQLTEAGISLVEKRTHFSEDYKIDFALISM